MLVFFNIYDLTMTRVMQVQEMNSAVAYHSIIVWPPFIGLDKVYLWWCFPFTVLESLFNNKECLEALCCTALKVVLTQ